MTGNDFKAFFTQLFTSLGVKDSILILLFLFIAFLLGWLFRSFSARSKVRKLKKELSDKEKSLIAVEANYNALEQQFKLREDELKKIELELDELQVGHESLYKEKEQMGLELSRARTEINQLGAYQSELVDANLQIEQLNTAQTDKQVELDQLQAALTAANTQVEQLGATHSNQQTAFDSLQSELSTATTQITALQTSESSKQAEIDELQTQIAALKAQLAELEVAGATGDEEIEEINFAGLDDITAIQNNYATTVDRLAAIEQKLQALESENAGLKEKIADIQPVGTAKELLVDEEDESGEEKAVKARLAIGKVLGGRIKKAAQADRDDLKKINGVGPFIEEKLNEIGIYTYEQISQFDDEFIEQVTAAIQFFPGRIKRDDWVGQAQKLMA